jgi:hypothetical protein
MSNKLTNILLVAILAIGAGILIVSLRPEVQKEITVNAPEVTVTPASVYPNITVSPADVVVEPMLGAAENEFYSGVSSTVVSISATSVTAATNKLVSANPGRQYLRMQNMGNTAVTCQLSSATTTLVLGTGIVLYASGTVNSVYEITPDNLYKGQINCMALTATDTISVVEK